jgi:trk system potassium uptake protein TrkH
MRWRYILNIIGILTFFFGLTMVLPLLVGLYYRDPSVIPLVKSMGITVAAGLIVYIIFKSGKAEIISQREGMAIVAVGWTAAAVLFRKWNS